MADSVLQARMLEHESPNRTRMAAHIPAALHYVWFGSHLPFFAQLAMRSALVRCPTANVTLWLGPKDPAPRECPELHGTGRFEVKRFELESTLDRITQVTARQRDAAIALWARLTKRAAQANVARLAILAAEGGVYLDTDTLVLQDLTPLLSASAFCGLEPVLWPAEINKSWGVYRLIGAPALACVREALAFLPKGYRSQSRIEGYYSFAANNAVVGMQPGHSLVFDAFERITHMPDAELLRRYRLGTHLLQELIASGSHDIVCHPPERFYPLGPVLSRHFFWQRTDAADATREIIQPGTFAVHWYASVSDLAHADESWIRGKGANTVFGQLCAPLLAG